MKVGVPSEIKPNEHRVGLTPTAVREYVERGHEVAVQAGAGTGAGYADEAYRRAGAAIVADAEAIFAASKLIVKVKEPQPSEWVRLNQDHILFTYLHLAPDPEQTRDLLNCGVTAIAYETVTDPRGGLPLLAPMSEVAGRLAPQAGAWALQKANGGEGVLLGGVPGVHPANVVIIGGGVVGTAAARVAAGMGAHVTVLDINHDRLTYLDDIHGGRLRTRTSNEYNIEEIVLNADLVIGAVLIPGGRAPHPARPPHDEARGGHGGDDEASQLDPAGLHGRPARTGDRQRRQRDADDAQGEPAQHQGQPDAGQQRPRHRAERGSGRLRGQHDDQPRGRRRDRDRPAPWPHDDAIPAARPMAVTTARALC